jgi:hypothetical protein
VLKRALCFFVLCALGCHQNYEEGSHPQPIPPQPVQMPANHPAPTSEQSNKPVGEVVIGGTIRIEPSLVSRLPKQAVLYLIARPAPSGPPIAIKRMPLPTFPYAYTLTQADTGMMPGQEVDLKSLDALYLAVKIDQDGKVGPAQAGDMEGVFESNPVAPGTLNADIIIDKVH